MKLIEPREALIVPNHGSLLLPGDNGFEINIGGDSSLKSKIKATLVGFSNAFETAILEHITAKTTLTVSSPTYLALCTAAVDDTKTGSTITEANYTGYARASITGATWNAAVSGDPSSTITTGSTITFANCTALTSTVTYWALCTASTAGNVIMWGTCPSTVISTTQTPPTVAAGAIVLSQD